MEFFGQKTMAIGVDATHPAAGSGCDAKSIAAVVASTGIDFAQFPGCIRIQTGRVEMVEKLSKMMRARLDLWKAKNNNVLPDRVVLFRDGVSEGQLETVPDKAVPDKEKS
jgi:eukaryotic translation initiation factor 2C